MSRTRQAAAEIVALINASPRSPTQAEIEAVIARVASSPVPTTSPLLEAIRDAARRLEEAFTVYAVLTPDHVDEEVVQARIDQIQAELEKMEGQIPSPPQSFVDLVAWAEIARSGAGIHKDGTIAETQEADVFERPAARLIEAVLQFPGATSMGGMSPAHAAHYREWRGLLGQHMREFEKPDDANEAGRITEETEAEEARMAAHMAVIDALTDRIFAVPARTWGDVMLYAQVCFWHHWAGVDPEGPDAQTQMRGGPFSLGGFPAQTLGKLLEAVFTVAGVGQFAEERSQP